MNEAGNPPPSAPRPLAGLLVVSLEQAVAAPLCSGLLAGAGAGTGARLGFGSDTLRARHPRLITVEVSGYGEQGEYARMKAYDLLIQGESGLASVTGTPDAPGRVGVSICDIASGMYAYAGVLEALLLRNATGRGSGLHVSLFGAAANWMTVPLLHHDYGGAAPARMGLSHPSIAPYGAFVTADGTPVLVAVQNEREWCAFCRQVLEAPELAANPAFSTNRDRVAHRTALDELIGGIVRRLDAQGLATRLNGACIAWGRVNSVADLSGHPQLRRERVNSPTGPVDRVAHPVEKTAWSQAAGPVPALGQHDASVRAEFRRR